MNSLLFLLLCTVLALLAWGAFQILGNCAFLFMVVIVVALLVSKAGKPKFGPKK
ncbi:hypothetical protein [Acidovorax sp. SUPP3334]|uniref:hypothetical protein n=1 Tax=Acidovorax sp. SUPP3334 TaxID=2920881 RepID=UPI0023DE5CFE|nr:hypothetical protein [Acidovorax sp. SUPP3334]GKT23177.1 hypothetical protein AVHM3334_10790 [Acidovorax sp. SUPP3334]